MAWRMLDPLNFLPPNAFEERHGYATQLWHGFKHFGTAGKSHAVMWMSYLTISNPFQYTQELT